MSTKGSNKSVTVRELGGELWAEASQRLDDEGSDWLAQSGLIDLAMSILARHTGARIVNDQDLPVKPLPRASEEP